MSQTTTRAQQQPAGLDLPVERLRAQLAPSCAPGCARRSTTIASPTSHCAARSQPRLRTQRLAIPPLAQLGHVVGRRAAPATTRPPAWPAPAGRGPAAGRASRRSAPRPTGSVSRPAPVSGTTSSSPPPSQHATTGTPGHQRLRRGEAEALALGRERASGRRGRGNPATSAGGTAPAKRTNGAMPSRSTWRSSAARSGPSPTMVSGRSWPHDARNAVVSIARWIRFCAVSRATTTAPPPPVVQGQARLSTGIGWTCAGGDVAAGGGLDPARQLAGDGGDDPRAREHRPRQPARQPGAPEQRGVGAVHGEHQRRRSGGAARPAGTHQCAWTRSAPAATSSRAAAPERPPEPGERPPAARAPGARPPWCPGRRGSRAGPTRSAPGARARRRPPPPRPAPRRSARRPAPRRPRRTSAAARVPRNAPDRSPGQRG